MSEEITVDGRWLEPPAPIEMVLTALDLLRPGQHVRFLLHREPLPLYGMLENMGYRHRTEVTPDGCFQILIEPLSTRA